MLLGVLFDFLEPAPLTNVYKIRNLTHAQCNFQCQLPQTPSHVFGSKGHWKCSHPRKDAAPNSSPFTYPQGGGFTRSWQTSGKSTGPPLTSSHALPERTFRMRLIGPLNA